MEDSAVTDLVTVTEAACEDTAQCHIVVGWGTVYWSSVLGLSCLVAGSAEAVSFPLGRPSVAWPGRSRRGRRGGSRVRKRIGGTWLAKGSLELTFGLAAAGG